MTTSESTTEAAPKKKGKGKLMIIIIAVVFLAAGGGGGYFMLKGDSGHEEEPKPEAGVVIPLDSITLNLADGHFLKLKMALQATAEMTEEADGSKALDLAVSTFSDMEVAELSSEKARAKVKAELLEKIKEAYEGHIMDIYFTEFVMQ